MSRLIFLCLILLGLSCSKNQAEQKVGLDSIAEDYVKLVLDVGLYDEGYVDFYYGPEEWRPEPFDSGEANQFPYESLRSRAEDLLKRLDSWDDDDADELVKARWSFLKAHAEAVVARIDMLDGKKLSFAQESRALFNADMPSFKIDDFKPVLAELDSLIPGKGSLKDRLDVYRNRFVVPPDKVALVMRTALDSARNRTKAHVDLPKADSCTLEIVTDKPWRAFNAFKGNSTSVIELNVDSPVRIGMVLDYACHEGYPGHHVHASLWEQKLYHNQGWVEFSISPLYAPSSLLAEGIAENAAGIVFPSDEALNFEKEVLYPLAGLDPGEAERYRRINSLVDSLKWVTIIVAQEYLDGEISQDEAMNLLTNYALMSHGAAEHMIPAMNIYRSYFITYKHGKKMVADWLDNEAGSSGDSEKRWQAFYELMTTPVIPSELMGD